MRASGPLVASSGAPPPPAKEDPRWRDSFLITLTFATGVADVASYLGLGQIFTANMTGNTVFLAIAIGQRDLVIGLRSAVALLAFGVGALVAGRYLEPLQDRSPWPRGITKVLWAQLAFVTAFSFLWIACRGVPTGPGTYLLISLSATGMGMQSSAGRKLAVPGVTTNVLTMAFTGLMAELAALGISGPNERRWTAVILALASGAALGGWLFVVDRPLLPLPLIGAVAGVCAVATVHGRRPTGTASA